MNNIERNIICWENIFENYYNIVNNCNNSISSIGEIKNNLTKLLGNQKKDDIVFYKSIIDNSHFYLTNSLKIRKNKFIIDLNNIILYINDCKQIDTITLIPDSIHSMITASNFSSIMKDYRKMAEKINYDKENNTILTWVKHDRIDSMNELDKNMHEVMNYHIKIITNLYNMIELERHFYCGNITVDNVSKDNENTEYINNKDTEYINKNTEYINNNTEYITPFLLKNGTQ